MKRKAAYYFMIILVVFLVIRLVNNRKTRDRETPSIETQTGELEKRVRSLAGTVSYSRHARCRMACRHIDETEVREILQNGEINRNRIEESDKGITVPLEGTTHDQQHVRIVVAPKEQKLVLVTVIDLDTDWPCDCP